MACSMKAASPSIRRSMGSRASLVSLSSTSSLSMCSSLGERVSSRPSLGGDSSRRLLGRSSSSSSVNLSALASNRPGPSFPCGSKPSTQPTTRNGQQDKALSEQKNWLLYTFISTILFRISRYILHFLQVWRPEASYMVSLIKTAVENYREEYVLNQHFAVFALSSASSISSMMAMSPCRSHHHHYRRVDGAMPDYPFLHEQRGGDLSHLIAASPSPSSEDFFPKAKLIDTTGTDDDCGCDQWGHFADFDTHHYECQEEEEFVFVGPRFQLETLDEHNEELAEDDYY